MPVTDRIKRYGINGIGYPVGPVNLRKPRSGSIPAELSRLSGGYALVDRWEVTTGSGLSAGDYTFQVGPYSERGFKASHRALGNISVYLQVGGVANPLAPVSCLGRKRPTGSGIGASLGPFAAAAGDRMWLVVERKDLSTLKYQVEVEREELFTSFANSIVVPLPSSAGSTSYLRSPSTGAPNLSITLTNNAVPPGPGFLRVEFFIVTRTWKFAELSSFDASLVTYNGSYLGNSQVTQTNNQYVGRLQDTNNGLSSAGGITFRVPYESYGEVSDTFNANWSDELVPPLANPYITTLSFDLPDGGGLRPPYYVSAEINMVYSRF